jgi:hypothetical protein
MTHPSDKMRPMADPGKHATILRRVSFRAYRDAQSAISTASLSPSEANLRAAYQACVFAKRSLLRASEANPDEEEAMIEAALLIGETGVGLLRKLAQMTAPDAR